MTPEPPRLEDWLPRLVAELHEDIRYWRTIALIAICAALAAVVIAGATGGLAIRNTSTLEKRERKDAAQARRDAAQARSEARDLRAAAWRGCIRDQYERSEEYVSQQVAIGNPRIRELFPPSLIAESLKRRRARLPILNCAPNLCGARPTILGAAEQARFIRRYSERDLDPNPSPPEFFNCPKPARDFRAN